MRHIACPHCGETVIRADTSGAAGRLFDVDRCSAGRWRWSPEQGAMVRGSASAVPVGHLPHEVSCEQWEADTATVYAFQRMTG